MYKRQATSCYTGEIDDARYRLRRYHELAPIDSYSNFFDILHTTACLMVKDYHGAAANGRRCVRENPDFVNGYKPLISALGHLGLLDEARRMLDALIQREPGFCLEAFRASYPFKHESDRAHYVEGMRKAGAPETVHLESEQHSWSSS